MNQSPYIPPSLLEGNNGFEQAIVDSLNLDSWNWDNNLANVYERLGIEVSDALKNEKLAAKLIRDQLIPYVLDSQPLSIEKAFYQFDSSDIESAHKGLLFNGGVEACDGTIVSHDTLPLTVTQIGICTVSYQGEHGAYAHRLYRRDLTIKEENPLQDLMLLLEQRRKRGAQGVEENTNRLSTLAQRGLMAYAERAILMDKGTAKWRMGHGSPIPFELMTGFWASRIEMAQAAIELMTKIIEYKRFVFIPSAPSRRELLAIGNALRPLEYLIIGTLKDEASKAIERGNARGDKRKMQEDFVERFGDDVVIGLYRASAISPPFLFYAHRDYVEIAALIAIADSVLQEQRGFPMLINIADTICSATFSPETFFSTVRQAYAEAGDPFRYLSERETRTK